MESGVKSSGVLLLDQNEPIFSKYSGFEPTTSNKSWIRLPRLCTLNFCLLVGLIWSLMCSAVSAGATVSSVLVKQVPVAVPISNADYAQIDSVNGLAFALANGAIYCYNMNSRTQAGISSAVSSSVQIDAVAGSVVAATNGDVTAVTYTYNSVTNLVSFTAPVTTGRSGISYSMVKDISSSYLILSVAWDVCRYDTNNLGPSSCTGYLGTNTMPYWAVQFYDNFFLTDGAQAGGYIVDKTNMNSNHYYYAFRAGCKGLASERNTGKIWQLSFELYIFVPVWDLRYSQCSGGGCSDSQSTGISSSANGLQVLPSLEMILVHYNGNSIELRDRNSLNVISQIGGSDGTGSIDSYSMSRDFYYDPYTAGGHVFAYCSGSTFKLMVIKPPCGVANCFSCGIDPVNRCEMGNPGPGIPNNATTYYFIKRPWTSTDVCVLYASIPAGFGINCANIYGPEVIKCADPNCQDCKNDAAICVLCNPTWYVYNQGCTQPPFPPQFGISLNGTHVEPCLDPYCFNCEATIAACSACMPATYLYQENPSPLRVICLPKPLFPLRYGLNLGNQYVESCQVPYCYQCQDDNSICSACEPGYFLKDNLDNLCIDKPSFPPSYGVFGKRTQPCVDPNCADCIDYKLFCKTCAVNWYMFNSGCLDKPNFLPTQGVDLVTNYVVQCQDPQCIDCKDDYKKCVKCNLPFYVLFDKCEIVANFPIGYGIDVAGGSVKAQPCVDSQCSDCYLDNLFCMTCFPNWYVNRHDTPWKCYQKTGFQQGAGAMGLDLGTNRVEYCTAPGCIKCIDDYTICECDNPADKWWFNNVCTLRTAIPPGYGIDFVSKKVLVCADSANCELCQDNIQLCTKCIPSALKPYLFVAQCVDHSGVPDFYGVNPVTMVVESCRSDTNCLKCLVDSAVCTKCAQSTNNPYLYGNKCIVKDDIPVTMGPDANGVILPCEVDNCADCRKTKAVCNGCVAGFFLFVERNICVKPSAIPQQYGIRGTEVVSCNENQCLDCRLNSMQCFVYYQIKADVTKGGALFKYDLMYTLRIYKESLGGVSTIAETDSKLLNIFLEQLRNSTTITVVKSDTRLLQLDLDPVKAVTEYVMGKDNLIYIRVKLQQMIFTDYKVDLAIAELKFVVYAQNYGVREYLLPKNFVSLPERAYSGEVVRGQAAMFDPTSLLPIPESQKVNVISVAAGGAALMDTMFLIVKFGQFIKLLTKMQFININFGSKLRAFLQATTDMFKPPLLTNDNQLEVYQAVGYRARVTDAKISLNFWGILGDKVCIYLGSWVLRIILNFKLLFRGRPHKIWLLLMHFHPKVHIILLNLFFLDFFFYGTRAMTHTRIGVYFSKYLAALTCGVVCLDLYLLAMIAFDHDKWARRFYHNERERIKIGLITEKALEQAKNRPNQAVEPQDKKSDPTIPAPKDSENLDKTQSPDQAEADISINPLLATLGNALKGNSSPEPESDSKAKSSAKEIGKATKTDSKSDKLGRKSVAVDVPEGLAQLFSKILTAPKASDHLHELHKEYENDPQEGYEYSINYRKAFDLIHQETFYIEALESTLRLDPKVYSSSLARAHGVVALIRLSMYQLIIICGQYSNGLVIGLLLFVELSKFAYTVVAYKKYKHLRTVIAFAAECLQSLFLITFLVIGFILHFQELTETVSMSYQVTGIWLIISAVLTEYFLLLVNGLFAGVAAFQEMRIKKKYKKVVEDMKKKAKEGKSKLQLILDEKAQGAIPYSLVDPDKIRLENTPYGGDDIQLEEYKKYLERKRRLSKLKAIESEKKPLLFHEATPDNSNLQLTSQITTQQISPAKESVDTTTGASQKDILKKEKTGIQIDEKIQQPEKWQIAPQKPGRVDEDKFLSKTNKIVVEDRVGQVMGRRQIRVVLPSTKNPEGHLIRVRPKIKITGITNSPTDKDFINPAQEASVQEQIILQSPSDISKDTADGGVELTSTKPNIATELKTTSKPAPEERTWSALERLGFKKPEYNANRDMSSRFRQRNLASALGRAISGSPN